MVELDIVRETLESFRRSRAGYEHTKAAFLRGDIPPRNTGAPSRLQTVEDWTHQLDEWISELDEAILILEAPPRP